VIGLVLSSVVIVLGVLSARRTARRQPQAA
jgi:hypothetical protein